MKLSVRNIGLALGFFSVSIFSAAFSILAGGSSIRIGLIIAVGIFFLLAMPFGIRYFVTSKIIVFNGVIFYLVLIFYLISTLMFTEVDTTRFLLSFTLLVSLSLASLAFVTTLDSLSDEFFDKMILFGFYFLLCFGYIILVRVVFFGYETKHMLLFSEPSHYAIVFSPFLFYTVFIENKKPYASLYMIAALVIALGVQSLVLLVGCLLILLLLYGTRFWSLVLLLSVLGAGVFVLDLGYFLERIDFVEGNQNLSTLVYLSGWERAYLSFTASHGFGVGFQQLGIAGPEGDFQIIMKDLREGVGLNVKDGGSLASKMIAEMGFLGLIYLLTYLYVAVKLVRKFFLCQVEGPKNIFFFGVYLLFSIELFIRGMGYFSLTSFLFCSSIYWIYRSRILAS